MANNISKPATKKLAKNNMNEISLPFGISRRYPVMIGLSIPPLLEQTVKAVMPYILLLVGYDSGAIVIIEPYPDITNINAILLIIST